MANMSVEERIERGKFIRDELSKFFSPVSAFYAPLFQPVFDHCNCGHVAAENVHACRGGRTAPYRHLVTVNPAGAVASCCSKIS